MSIRRVLARAKRHRDALQGYGQRVVDGMKALADPNLPEIITRAEHIIADSHAANVGQSDVHTGRLSALTKGAALRLAARALTARRAMGPA